MNPRVLLCCLALVGLGATTPGQEVDEPKELGIVERTGRRLGQLDVTVRGPDKVISDLGAADFEVVVGGEFIEDFLVDSLCSLPVARQVQPPSKIAETSTTEPVVAPRVRNTFLFYFDMHHLTMTGRQNALDLSRALIDDVLLSPDRLYTRNTALLADIISSLLFQLINDNLVCLDK